MRNLLVALTVLAAAACNNTVTTNQNPGATDDLGSSQGQPTDGGATDGAADGGGGGDAGVCGSCNAPPDDCHAKTGTCEGGVCVYAFVDGATCDDGNDCTVGDTCMNDGCFGTPMVCDAPPSPVCVDGSTEKTYDAQGTCNGGLCVYQTHTVTCPNGGTCSGSSCSTDICASITCDMPPSVCYAASGTCSNGSCSYGYADGATCDDSDKCTTSDSCATGVCQGIPTACDSPPADTCANSTTLKSYTSSGTCSSADGTCSYSYSYVQCAAGCASGACKATGWTANTSNTQQDLLAVWGASATQVWAVGKFGVVDYYDGSKWEVVPGPSTGNDDLLMIHGSSATDVYAATQYDLFHYDGTSWSKVVRITDGSFDIGGIWATGNATKDVYVSATMWSAGTPTPALMKVTGTGTISTIASATYSDPQYSECNSPSRGIWVSSSSDILVNGCQVRVWNGSTLDYLGPTTTGVLGGKIWSKGASSVFAISGWDGGEGINVSMWNGTSWTTASTGLSGGLTDVWGTGSKSVYFGGYGIDDMGNNFGAIVYWDGVGFTQQTVPSGVNPLTAMWGASNGKIFAVGYGGSIVTGP